MEEQHYDALKELWACTFLPGSWDKRFVRDLSSLPIEAELSSKQIKWLKRLYFRYRKQIMARNPDAEFDWTFDAEFDETPPEETVRVSYKIVCGPRRRRLSDEELALQKRYGDIPNNIADFWK